MEQILFRIFMNKFLNVSKIQHCQMKEVNIQEVREKVLNFLKNLKIDYLKNLNQAHLIDPTQSHLNQKNKIVKQIPSLKRLKLKLKTALRKNLKKKK